MNPTGHQVKCLSFSRSDVSFTAARPDVNGAVVQCSGKVFPPSDHAIFYACSSSCKAPQDSYLESHSESEFPASGPSRGEKRCESFDIYRCGLPMRKSNQIPKVVVVVSVAQSCPILCNPMDHARILCPWDFPGKNTGVGCHFLLQGIFLTQRSNSCLLHWQADSLPLSHQGSLEGGVGGGAGGTKITARESEQPLWLSGQ